MSIGGGRLFIRGKQIINTTHSSLLAFILVLSLVGGLGMKCTEEQKNAVINASLGGLVTLLSRSANTNPVLQGILTGVTAFQNSPSGDTYQRAIDAFSAVLAKSNLSPTVSALVNTALGIFKAFNPVKAAAAEAMSDEEAEAERKKLEKEFKKLERAVERLEKESK